jgi:anti-sigma B factor antagonist
MDMLVQHVGDVVILDVKRESIDANEVDAFKRDITPLLGSNKKVVLDFRDMRFIDSAGIVAILSCLRTVASQSGELKLSVPNESVRSELEITRIHRIIDVFGSVDEAVASFLAPSLVASIQHQVDH